MKCGSRLSCCALLLILPLITTSHAAAQAPAPLNFGNNFFVTGDYIVAGAYNMTSSFQTINGVSYAVGTIKVPDANSKGTKNPGIQGPTSVPPGAQIVTALLYWQTVEKVGVMPGQAGSGQNAFFRPVVTGGVAAPGYAIQATNVTGANTVSWSSGGCNSGSTGKLLRTYRADVGGALPLDGSGNPTANGTFEVRIPSSGNATPLTLGATLVVIYRVPGGVGVPLNAIVIYDGDYSQSNSALTMTQSMQGFYDAAKSPASKITHIVGGGQTNKFQSVFLASGGNKSLALPLLYGKNSPAFPGWYGTWDNPTWIFNNPAVTSPGVQEGASSITTQVVPAPSMQGCVSWGAVIVSTTVKNTDGDGILDSWKNDARGPGYCDASINNGSCTGAGDPNGAWVDLTGAMSGQKDIFLQYDYLCSSITNGVCATGGANYSFDPRLAVDPADTANAIDKVVTAFDNHQPFKLHAIPGNAILENDPNNLLNLSCTDSAQTGPTCPFPNVLGGNGLGTIGFRDGLTYIKNESVNPNTGSLCSPGAAGCTPVFQHGKKDSYHYALFSHGVGLPSWFVSDGSLKTVSQTGSTATFTTSTPHGIAPIPGDFCQFGRVTVVYAISNPSLEGTYCVLQKGLTSTTFSITVGGTPTKTTVGYNKTTDPNLSVANGQVSSMSGFSDVGGQDSVISLGYGAWGPPTNPASDGNKWQVKAGTFMHELGHTLGLTHGDTFYGNLGNKDYTPTFEVNCKPNLQSIMNYQFQVDLLEVPNTLDRNGNPLMVVDYSKDALNTLVENQPQGPGSLSGASYANTAWFELTSFAGGTKTSPHCDGSSSQNDPTSYAYVADNVNNFSWSNASGLDINFNGSSKDVMHGHDEWEGTVQAGVLPSPGLDLQQVSSIGTITTVGLGGESGALKPAGGGGALKPAGGGGALKPAGGGGALKPAGGGGITSDITHEQANSYARPPRGLTIVQEEPSPRKIDLSWFIPTFGTPIQYNIYRSAAGGPFSQVGSVPGSQTTFTDTVVCNLGGYQYRITAVTQNDSGTQQESTPSNTVPATGEPKLTGCYTVTSFAPAVAQAVQASSVAVNWTLQDDFFVTPPAAWKDAQANVGVTNNNLASAKALYAVGPVSTDQCAHVTQGRTLLVSNGTKQAGVDAFTNNGDVFTFTWNNTDNFCAGSYTFELDLDSGQTFTSSAVQLSIDINDSNTSPHITTATLPAGTVAVSYNDTLTEDGGTPPLTWTVTGLPTGISQIPAASANLSGTTCVAAGSYAVSAMVTDSATKPNSGSQNFTLQINKGASTTSVASNVNPSVFQQSVTFTVTVASTPASSCTPTGTVTLSVDGTQVGSNSLVNGTATFSMSNLSVSSPGAHSITASYSGDASFNASNNNSTPWSQTVNKAPTQVSFNSVSPSPVFVGQPITVSYTFSVVVAGTGSPIAPTGNITVTASDGSSCVAMPTLGGGMCTLAPAPKAAGNVTFTISYSGDGNFLAGLADGNSYNVYQLAFTTQPATTGVGLTMPSVVVTAQDFNNSNQPLTSFIGGVTLAIGSGPGTLSGTTTQNAVAGVATFSDLSINKIATGDTLKASPDGVVFDATSSAFNIDTFYVDNQGNFGTLDLATGTATQIAAATVPNSTGIDLTSDLRVFAYSSSNQLTQITPSTGAASSIGTGTIPTLPTTGALTNGTYFGIDAVGGGLYSIDLNSGATTLVGNTSLGVLLPAGCTYETSLTGSGSVLYYTIGYGGASCSPLNDTFYQIDPKSGTVTSTVALTIGGSGVNGFVGSAFVGGTLYGFTSDGKEYSINPSTGVATLLHSTTAAAPIIGAGSQ